MELRTKEEIGRGLLDPARELAFGHNGVVMAAEAAAAGSVCETDQLSERDRELLGIGTLAGAIGAIAATRHPYGDVDAIELADIGLAHGRTVGVLDRKDRPLFSATEAVA